MSKVLVIPDVHLKAWMLEQASEIVEKEHFDKIVMLGDLMDDWYQEMNLELYQETIDAVVRFVSSNQNTLFCYGNHDVSYLWDNAYESGYSSYAEEIAAEGIERIVSCLPRESTAFIHRIDNVLFSHAGLTESFVIKHFAYESKIDIDDLIARINKMGVESMWEGDSPIWARPQNYSMRLYPADMFQVVGHTPVEAPLKEDNLLTLDNFSTYSNGYPIGDEKFVWVDTKSWEYHVI